MKRTEPITYNTLVSIAEKHGYVFTAHVPVHYDASGQGIVIHHAYKHKTVKGVESLLLGFWQIGEHWYFDAHKSGSGYQFRRNAEDMDKFLKAHVARAIRKCQTPGNCPYCGRKATHGNFCSPYCTELSESE